MRAGLIILGALTLGCSVNVSFPVGLKCGDEVCPSGQRCEVGICVAGNPTDDDGGPLVDASVGFDAGTAVRECGGAAAYTQDFSDRSSTWFFESLGPGASIDGALQLASAAGSPSSTSVFSGPRIDIADSHWFARVSPSDGGKTTVGLKQGSEFITIEFEDGKLAFRIDYDVGTSVDYDATTHQFVGFREASGTFHFVTSPDGVVFTTHRSAPSPGIVRGAQAFFSAESDEDIDVVATIDDINGGVPTSYSFCPSKEFTDSFDGGSLSEQWSIFGRCEEVSLANGELSLVAVDDDFCIIEQVGLHDLRDSEMVLELGSAFSGYYKFALDGENSEFVVERFGTELRVATCSDDVCELPMAAPYVGERYLKFEGSSDGTVLFSFSADGVDYEEVRRSTPFDISRAKSRFHGNVGTENRITSFNN